MNDPFGRSDRTIIVPDPGGRRRAAPGQEPARPQPAPPPQPYPAQPYPPQPAHPPQPAPPAYPAPPAAYGAPRAGDDDDWASPDARPAPNPHLAAAPMERGRALVLKRDVVVAPNANAFLRAAGPLLLLLGRLRVQLSRAAFSNLMEQVAAAIDDFEKDTRTSGATIEGVRAAKYIVCATADDIVQNIPTDERHVWTQYSMLSRFFGERIGGVRFFEELERAKVDPVGNYDLLELIHACLGIGFQGVHRTSAGGAAALQQIQRNLYELLRRTRQTVREVSPRWQGQPLAAEAFRFRVPLWAVASVVAALLVGFFLALRALLSGGADAAATALVTVHPPGEIGIQRRVYAPPPPPPPPPSGVAELQDALKSDIANGSLAVLDGGGQIILRITAALFAPADARVVPAYQGLVQRVAAQVERVDGPVRVTGHTDVVPIHTVRFPSNFELSQERAKSVAAILRAGLSHPERLQTEGKGADVPVAPNTTPEGRARNRRVDIAIPRGK